MSHRASAWAWETTTGNSTRKSVLAAFADYAGADGTAAWPSIETIAARVECSVRTVQRQLQILIDEGFMRPGDQELVSHLRADKRPVVYDLAMSDLVQRQWKAAAERGDTVTPRGPEDGVSDCHPAGSEPGDTHDAPLESHGVTPVTERGDTGVTQFGNEPSTPQPPAERGAGSADCKRCTAGLPCRPHGTTPRQLQAAAARAAAERRRAADQAEAEADRARRAAAADPRTYVQQARAGLQEARRV